MNPFYRKKWKRKLFSRFSNSNNTSNNNNEDPLAQDQPRSSPQPSTSKENKPVSGLKRLPHSIDDLIASTSSEVPNKKPSLSRELTRSCSLDATPRVGSSFSTEENVDRPCSSQNAARSSSSNNSTTETPRPLLKTEVQRENAVGNSTNPSTSKTQLTEEQKQTLSQLTEEQKEMIVLQYLKNQKNLFLNKSNSTLSQNSSQSNLSINTESGYSSASTSTLSSQASNPFLFNNHAVRPNLQPNLMALQNPILLQMFNNLQNPLPFPPQINFNPMPQVPPNNNALLNLQVQQMLSKMPPINPRFGTNFPIFPIPNNFANFPINPPINQNLPSTSTATNQPVKNKRGPKPGSKRNQQAATASNTNQLFEQGAVAKSTPSQRPTIPSTSQNNDQDNADLDIEWTCEWNSCGKIFNSSDLFVEHVSKHLEAQSDNICRWSQCDRELKSFAAHYMLVLHVRKHTGDKPNRCELCNKAYSRRENLKTHMRTHTGEKPYPCTEPGCTSAFSNASDRAKHQNRTHSDAKPYKCPVEDCGKCYTDPSSLRKHIKTQHGDDIYYEAKENKAKNGRGGSYGFIPASRINQPPNNSPNQPSTSQEHYNNLEAGPRTNSTVESSSASPSNDSGHVSPGSEQNHSNEPNSTLSNNQPNDSNGTFNFSNNVDFVNKFSSFSIAPLNDSFFDLTNAHHLFDLANISMNELNARSIVPKVRQLDHLFDDLIDENGEVAIGVSRPLTSYLPNVYIENETNQIAASDTFSSNANDDFCFANTTSNCQNKNLIEKEIKCEYCSNTNCQSCELSKTIKKEKIDDNDAE